MRHIRSFTPGHKSTASPHLETSEGGEGAIARRLRQRRQHARGVQRRRHRQPPEAQHLQQGPCVCQGSASVLPRLPHARRAPSSQPGAAAGAGVTLSSAEARHTPKGWQVKQGRPLMGRPKAAVVAREDSSALSNSFLGPTCCGKTRGGNMQVHCCQVWSHASGSSLTSWFA